MRKIDKFCIGLSAISILFSSVTVKAATKEEFKFLVCKSPFIETVRKLETDEEIEENVSKYCFVYSNAGFEGAGESHNNDVLLVEEENRLEIEEGTYDLIAQIGKKDINITVTKDVIVNYLYKELDESKINVTANKNGALIVKNIINSNYGYKFIDMDSTLGSHNYSLVYNNMRLSYKNKNGKNISGILVTRDSDTNTIREVTYGDSKALADQYANEYVSSGAERYKVLKSSYPNKYFKDGTVTKDVWNNDNIFESFTNIFNKDTLNKTEIASSLEQIIDLSSKSPKMQQKVEYNSFTKKDYYNTFTSKLYKGFNEDGDLVLSDVDYNYNFNEKYLLRYGNILLGNEIIVKSNKALRSNYYLNVDHQIKNTSDKNKIEALSKEKVYDYGIYKIQLLNEYESPVNINNNTYEVYFDTSYMNSSSSNYTNLKGAAIVIIDNDIAVYPTKYDGSKNVVISTNKLGEFGIIENTSKRYGNKIIYLSDKNSSATTTKKTTTKKASSTTNNNSNKDKDNTIDKNPQTFDNLYLNIGLLLTLGITLLVVINKIKKIKNKLNNM